MEKKKGNGYLFQTIMAGSLTAALIVGGSAAKSSKKDTTEINLETGFFSVGEHKVIVAIDDPTEQIVTYEGHAGYRPIEIIPKYDDSYMVYINTVPVQVESTGTDAYGNNVYSNFGTPLYTVKEDIGVNEYAEGQHIISVPYAFDENEIEYHDGYKIAGISRESFGKEEVEGCILYVNDETVEYVYDADNDTLFGTPVEKGKVLEK